MVRVLIVDDELSNMSLLERFLSRTCHASVSFAGSAEEAIHAIKKEGHFDLIVCDYQMPGENGTKVYDSLGGLSRSPYFLLWTQARPDELPRLQGPQYLGSIGKSDLNKVVSLVTALDREA